MIQQVNLYQDKLKGPQTSPAFMYYAAGILAVPLLLMLLSFYLLFNINSLKAEVEKTRQQLGAEESRVTSLLARLPKQQNDTGFVEQIKLLQDKLNELSQTLNLLTQQKNAAQQGFSRYFQALAEQSVPDIWLSKIHIIGSRRIINLEGSTYKPEQVPHLLQQLENEPVFHGQTFAKLIMQKSELKSGQIDFKLNTTTDPKDSNDPN
jgi:hypothetical protein